MRKSIYLIILISLSRLTYSQALFTEVSSNQELFHAKNARGISLVDFDNDGDDDLFVAAEPLKILKNEGNFNFSDHTAASGIEVLNARNFVLFDANEDGYLDAFVSSTEYSYLYLNNQDATFTETASFGSKRRQSINFGDLNGDQWPDIYSANFNSDNNIYINQGNGVFVNASGDDSSPFLDMGAVMLDFEEDGDLDIYITYDGNKPNDLLLNDGQGNFENQSSTYGLDNKSSAMGIDFADFNLDGNYDFFIANLFENDLLLNNGDNTYSEIGASAMVDDIGMGWGTVCFDYNNDGLTDIYLNNEYYRFTPRSNQLLKNNGDLTFTDVASDLPLANNLSGYGCAVSDLDNNGLLDLVLVNLQDTSGIRIFRNEEVVTNNWVQFSLIGGDSNKSGIGARLYLYAQDQLYRKDVTAGSGYRSQNSFRQHFGLGTADKIDSLFIYWPSGLVQKFTDFNSGLHYLIQEGQQIVTFEAQTFDEIMKSESKLPAPKPTEGSTISITEGHSIAREWMEILLEGIRGDFARPTIHARNLFHISMAMYDSWSAFEPTSRTLFLGNNFQGFVCPFDGMPEKENAKKEQEEALSYSVYRLIEYRFEKSPSADETLTNAYKLMQVLGYDPGITSIDYSSGSSAALGNYIAEKIIEFGLQDGSNESNGYANQFYSPVNPPMRPELPGNPDCSDPNRWQQLELQVAIDQSGNPVHNVQPFLSPEWGQVAPFALNEADATIYQRDGFDYWVYHDPGAPPTLEINDGTGTSDEFKWHFELVSKWSSHLDAADNTLIDISPASIGNIHEDAYPETYEEYQSFFPIDGGDAGSGYAENPSTGNPYAEQMVARGDYTRVLAEFWADGPDSETPPGHWFTILNYVTDHPSFERKFMGEGEIMDLLEWDVKSYLTLGGAMHDVAITAWGIKGYYDYTRPIFAIRYMAELGQSSDSNLPNYHPAGIELLDDYIELVTNDDPLSGVANENSGKVKLKAWRGPDFIENPDTDVSGVDWILAENWWPYQRPSFVTPPFAGYISGHSTFSRAAAEVLTLLTGNEYFPNGLGEFHAPQNEFLVFEEGPSEDIILQWAKYKDASDQCSLSRIWGGIHPPADDIPGRLIGRIIGQDAFDKALRFFDMSLLANHEPMKEESFLFPNPAHTNSKIRTLIGNGLRVNCWEISGKKVFTDLSLKEDGVIPFEFKKEGIYVIEIITQERSYLHKLIVNSISRQN